MFFMNKGQPLFYPSLAKYSQSLLVFPIHLFVYIYIFPFLSAHMLKLDFRSEMSVMVTHEHAYLNKKNSKPDFPEYSDNEK